MPKNDRLAVVELTVHEDFGRLQNGDLRVQLPVRIQQGNHRLQILQDGLPSH